MTSDAQCRSQVRKKVGQGELKFESNSLINFSISLNIVLLLLSCCKSLDFTSSIDTEHIKIYYSHQLWTPKLWALVLQHP